MLLYIIDGFNIIYRIPSLKNSQVPQYDFLVFLRKHRLTGSQNNRVIIAFDGMPNSQVLQEKGGFEIFFSGRKSADELIKRILDKFSRKSEVVVVSDDRQVQDYARSQGARICRSADFLPKKQKKELPREEISESLQQQITEELKKIWLKEK